MYLDICKTIYYLLIFHCYCYYYFIVNGFCPIFGGKRIAHYLCKVNQKLIIWKNTKTSKVIFRPGT
jgi:hypothetical protein